MLRRKTPDALARRPPVGRLGHAAGRIARLGQVPRADAAGEPVLEEQGGRRPRHPRDGEAALLAQQRQLARAIRGACDDPGGGQRDDGQHAARRAALPDASLLGRAVVLEPLDRRARRQAAALAHVGHRREPDERRVHPVQPHLRRVRRDGLGHVRAERLRLLAVLRPSDPSQSEAAKQQQNQA